MKGFDAIENESAGQGSTMCQVSSLFDTSAFPFHAAHHKSI